MSTLNIQASAKKNQSGFVAVLTVIDGPVKFSRSLPVSFVFRADAMKRAEQERSASIAAGCLTI